MYPITVGQVAPKEQEIINLFKQSVNQYKTKLRKFAADCSKPGTAVMEEFRRMQLELAMQEGLVRGQLQSASARLQIKKLKRGYDTLENKLTTLRNCPNTASGTKLGTLSIYYPYYNY